MLYFPTCQVYGLMSGGEPVLVRIRCGDMANTLSRRLRKDERTLGVRGERKRRRVSFHTQTRHGTHQPRYHVSLETSLNGFGPEQGRDFPRALRRYLPLS